MREERPKWFARVVAEYMKVYEKGTQALEEGDWKTVGALMAENHRICRDELKLSIPELESIVLTATAAGAIGAKLSGTGRGGIAIALCSTKASQRKVADAVRGLPGAKGGVWEYAVGK